MEKAMRASLLFGEVIKEHNALLQAAKIVVVLSRQDPYDLDIYDLQSVIEACKEATQELEKVGIKSIKKGG